MLTQFCANEDGNLLACLLVDANNKQTKIREQNGENLGERLRTSRQKCKSTQIGYQTFSSQSERSKLACYNFTQDGNFLCSIGQLL